MMFNDIMLRSRQNRFFSYDPKYCLYQAIGGLLGTAGGASGSGFSGPGSVDITSPVTQAGINQAQGGVNQSLGGSNALLNALQQVNGVGNQQAALGAGAGLYNALAGVNGTASMGQAMGQQGGLNSALANVNGIGMQGSAAGGLQNVLAQQQATAGQLQGVANGTGPNPAQAMLNQSTGANVANQAALMAGQRGAGANVGLMARQAGQQGAGIQQQAAGQAATMQAQQQLGALNQMGAQQAGMANTNQALAGIGSGLTAAQQAGIAQQYGQGAGAIGQMQNQVGTNAAIAQNQVGNLAGATQANMQGNLSNVGQQIGAQGQYNATQAGQQGNVNSANAGLAGTSMQGQQSVLGGMINKGLAPAAGLIFGADGGIVHMAAGGMPESYNGPSSSFGQFLAGWGTNGAASGPTGDTAFVDMRPGFNQGAKDIKDAFNQEIPGKSSAEGNVQTPVSGSLASGPVAASSGPSMPMSMENMSSGGLARSGGGIAARTASQKAVKSGNSYANDKIPAMLSEGEVVIPRSIMQSDDPVGGAAKFVAALAAQRRG